MSKNPQLGNTRLLKYELVEQSQKVPFWQELLFGNVQSRKVKPTFTSAYIPSPADCVVLVCGKVFSNRIDPVLPGYQHNKSKSRLSIITY